jgi:hypothetical protein
MMNNGAGQDVKNHQPTRGDSPKEIVAKEDIYNFALQLLSSKRKKASVPDPVKEKEQVPADARLHPYFAARAKAPDHLSYKIALVQPHTIGGLHDQVYTQYTPSCHCRRPVSRGMKATSEETHICLKLYCECFAYGALCTERCACSSACFNNAAHSVERSRAVGAILQEDPNGFRRDMDWMTELQRSSRSEYLLPKEKKVVPKINTLDHEAITDDSLRLAKVSVCRVSMIINSYLFVVTSKQVYNGSTRQQRCRASSSRFFLDTSKGTPPKKKGKSPPALSNFEGTDRVSRIGTVS